MEVSLGKMNMAKAKLLESQRMAVMLAGVSPADGTMEPTCDSVESRQRRACPPRMTVLSTTNVRFHQVCVAYKCVNGKPTFIGQIHTQLPGKPGRLITRSVREYLPGGRVPKVALKRVNTRRAKGNRIPVKKIDQREGKAS